MSAPCLTHDHGEIMRFENTVEGMAALLAEAQADVMVRDEFIAGLEEELSLLRDDLRTAREHVLHYQHAIEAIRVTSTNTLAGVIRR